MNVDKSTRLSSYGENLHKRRMAEILAERSSKRRVNSETKARVEQSKRMMEENENSLSLDPSELRHAHVFLKLFCNN